MVGKIKLMIRNKIPIYLEFYIYFAGINTILVYCKRNLLI